VNGPQGGRPSREASGGGAAAQGGGTRREQEADSLIAGVEGRPLVFRVMMRQAQAQAQEAAEGEPPPGRPRRMRSAPQRIREDDSGGDSDADTEMEAGSDNSWDSGLRPSRKRERLNFSTDADTTSDDSDAMSSSDGAGSDGEPHADWATDLMDSTVAMKFTVGVHARTALKYWFKGTVTAMRMRRGEALYSITFVDGTRSLTTEDIIILNDYVQSI